MRGASLFTAASRSHAQAPAPGGGSLVGELVVKALEPDQKSFATNWISYLIPVYNIKSRL